MHRKKENDIEANANFMNDENFLLYHDQDHESSLQLLSMSLNCAFAVCFLESTYDSNKRV